ncbi:hypothetical protein L4X63_23410 [Geomonas sp. Red32]|uniref:hypothetical protein n=1 Tax=Geomonas sp. Red32 TaxID=2912856 RepID=UPI00202CB9D2|nr:hypothetical protein [Geomonas sp. Red32]MCM0084526.1 hypothetical protein [Geomonas sp. Red32]
MSEKQTKSSSCVKTHHSSAPEDIVKITFESNDDVKAFLDLIAAILAQKYIDYITIQKCKQHD